jgi:hypothetical protein
MIETGKKTMSTQAKKPSTPLRVFYSYAREDEEYLRELEKHLVELERQGLITSWFDQQRSPGADWSSEIIDHLITANIILLLVSQDFIASDFIYEKELQVALRRHELREARVIPIILRPSDWKHTPFAKFQVLPRGGLPVSIYPNRDEAFRDIVSGIRYICEDIVADRDNFYRNVAVRSPRLMKYSLAQVFVKSGFPEKTFVEPENFALLKLALQQPGRGVVIEGPSGVGKTTSVQKAVEDLRKGNLNLHLAIEDILSARNPKDHERLQTIRDWHENTVIVDDFHRLDIELRQALVDYLKELADTTSTTKKLAIIGIPRTGQVLVDISFDLATRIDVFKLGKAKDESILQMIKKGEEALNIKFDRKSEIVLAANGSLNIAQFLCFDLCASAGIIETQEQTQFIKCDIDAAIKAATIDLERKFGSTIRQFIALGGPEDLTSLRLLEELTLKESGSLSLSKLKFTKPYLVEGIERFITEKWMEKLYILYPASENYLSFDPGRQALVIDDPQLDFYLKQVRLASLARESGKTLMIERRKVLISYSHSDIKWLNRLRVHLAPIEREGAIDLWDDTRIAAGQQWKEPIRDALERARVVVLLISANFLASDFLVEGELPVLLAHAEVSGTTIIPVILSSSAFTYSAFGMFQSINSPDRPISDMEFAEQERIFAKVAQTIIEQFREA